MERVRILGIDPSLRNSGLAVVSYNNELPPTDPQAFTVEHCQVLANPMKYKKKDAILNMIDMLQTESQKACYEGVDTVVIEAPQVLFKASWAAGTMATIAHISGASIACFGVDRSYIFYPSEWTHSKKKESTHAHTQAFLGSADLWHYEKRIKSEKLMEHILDAASLALWFIKNNFVEE